MRKKNIIIIATLLFAALVLFGVMKLMTVFGNHVVGADEASISGTTSPASASNYEDSSNVNVTEPDNEPQSEFDIPVYSGDEFVIPAYYGEEIVQINQNVPDFDDLGQDTEEYVLFSELDELGRPGCASACIGPSTLPTEERESIGMIKPPGWHTVKYDFIDRLYLYNRCHLIAYELCGVNADERNLITGTRYLNIDGMLGIENRVAWYVRDTGSHVYYRVTPRYEGSNLLATGVQIEAKSVEDGGESICLNVFCFNVQPGVLIDYATGDNFADPDYEVIPDRAITSDHENESADEHVRINNGDELRLDSQAEGPMDGQGETAKRSGSDDSVRDQIENNPDAYVPSEGVTYILNTNTLRFHRPDCQSVWEMKPKNRKEYFGSREELIEAGYKSCARCNP